MKILLRTNLDVYRTVSWQKLNVVPRVGEIIMVPQVWVEYCQTKGIPRRLEVSQVYYYEDSVVVDMWYNDTDFKLYNADGRLLEKS